MWWIAVFQNHDFQDCGDLQDWEDAVHRFHPCSRVRHWDRLWSSSHQGRGDSAGCVGLLYAPPCGYCLEAGMTAALHYPSGLRIKSAMTRRRITCRVPQPCGYCLEASMTAARSTLWIPAYAGMTVGFAKVSLMGEESKARVNKPNQHTSRRSRAGSNLRV